MSTLHLGQRDQEKLLIHVAAQLARSRQARGLLLTYPEAMAILTAEIMEGARDGRSVADLMAFGKQILTADDVLPGVAAMIEEVQVEATFPDGTKLVTVHEPIPHDDEFIPGEVLLAGDPIVANAGREVRTVTVRHTGDRPIQVGSHMHVFEVNRALRFDRAAAFGHRLNIPAGTAVRFEPGEQRDVEIVPYGGAREIHGHNALTNGPAGEDALDSAMANAIERGFAEASAPGEDGS